MDKRKDTLAKLSTLLLIVALALELVCLVRTNQLSATVVGSLSERSNDAANKSGAALEDANGATLQANSAITQSQEALGKAKTANEAASTAAILAREARKEADSFEKDIVSANKQATDAESHLAEALKRAADATAELERISSPRSLTHVTRLVAELSAFKNTRYGFFGLFGDEESANLLRSIDSLLQSADWHRETAPHRFPALNVPMPGGALEVPSVLSNGLCISVEAQEDLSVLSSMPLDKLPTPVKEATMLHIALLSNVVPLGYGCEKVNVERGQSPLVKISVGKKH